MTTNFFVSEHPLVADKIARLRDRRTPPAEFHRLVGEIAMVLGCDALSLLKTKRVSVRTPLSSCRAERLAQEITFVSILRAGLAMTDGLMKLEPRARLAHIGIYRNEETLEPVRYYARFPKELEKHFVLLADPMLATGGSAVESLKILKSRGAARIAFICVIAAKPGVKKVHEAHPDVPIFAGALDEELNQKGYIVPGLGDAGDRMFGTV